MFTSGGADDRNEIEATLGLRRGATPEGADLVILNTCNIREKAA